MDLHSAEESDEPGASRLPNPYLSAAPQAGHHFDQTVPAAQPGRFLTARDLRSRPRHRRLRRPLVLFLLCCLSTFFAGATNWLPVLYVGNWDAAGRLIQQNWQQGLIYMAAVIGILLTHEMGHFLQTVRYGVPATLPTFIPVPVIMTGTMGAVIAMEGSRADRKQLFDIGISGPLAGLAVALPIIWYGIKTAGPMPASAELQLGHPLIFRLLTNYLRPELPPGTVLNVFHPLLMAGWVGMLVTGLNMLPVSQLDGGHVIYGLFGRKAHLVARTFLVMAIASIIIFQQYNWSIMLILVILLGVDHPPTRDDSVKLGPLRCVVGALSLLIPVFCFTPVILS
jgi:membrane-associated protease RseP (regulator of RpoE activity)